MTGKFVVSGRIVCTPRKTASPCAGVDAARADREKTPLAKKLDEFGSQLTLVIGGICAATFAASVPRFGSPVFGGNRLKGAAHYAKGAARLGVPSMRLVSISR